MEMVALYDAKNRLSKLCKAVSETGEPCVISRRGKPYVKLVPVHDDDATGSVWGTVEEAQARYGPLDTELDPPARERGQRSNPLDARDS